MNKLNNRSGFTLIEIIVVLIIIGILAAIALPNLFSNVATSKGSQALQSANSFTTPLETCVAKNSTMPSVAPCDFVTLFTGGNVTEVAVGSGFDVVLSASGGTVAGNNIDYDLKGIDRAGATAFTLYRNPTGSFTCTASVGVYASVC